MGRLLVPFIKWCLNFIHIIWTKFNFFMWLRGFRNKALTEGRSIHRTPEKGFWRVAVMYSPQSLHRWGITHSESMERLAYSQGKTSQLTLGGFRSRRRRILTQHHCKILIISTGENKKYWMYLMVIMVMYWL